MDLTLIVLAAGMSSRYGEGLKQVDGVGPDGESLVDYGVFDAIRAGFTHIVFVARPEIEQAMRARLDRLPRGVSGDVVFQSLDDLPGGASPPPGRRKPWGTGQAVLAAAPVVRAPFAVINADDFYGAEAYTAMADYLCRARWTAPHPAAMIGYRLRDTLSPHAAVSRAICQMDPTGHVARVAETFDIADRDGRLTGRTTDHSSIDLDGTELVSMNFWGFQPPVLGMLRAEFARFLAAHGEDETLEFLLSSAANDLVAAGHITLRVLATGASWCGMTSRADREVVAARLVELTAAGVYPRPLFRS